MKVFKSIRFRLNLWFLFFLVIVIFFFTAFTYIMLSQNVSRTSFGQVQTTSFNVDVKPINPDYHIPPSNNPANILTSDYRPLAMYELNQDFVKKIQAATTFPPLSIVTPQGEITMDQKAYITQEMEGSQQVWLYYRPSPSQSGYFEVLVVVLSMSNARSVIDDYRQVLLISIPITLLLAAFLGYFLVSRMLKPVNAMAKTAREIHDKDLSRRIEVKSGDELGQLASTLNQTFDGLQKAIERERQFTADASHELRTPLAIMQGEASLALSKERSAEEYQKSLQVISQKISQMSSTINKLLTLARADNGKENLTLEPINLSEFLAEIASDIETLCEDKSLTFKLEEAENVVVKGDKIKLRGLFLNLLDNAVRYTPAGGQITLSLERDGGNARISVKDTAIGIPKEHLAHIFERFYRVNKAHSVNDGGTGLGLAICQHIVEQHQGKIEVTSQIGGGSTFTVTLPLMPGS